MTQDKNQFQWQPLVELIVVMMTILGSTIPLYIHTDSKIDAMRADAKEFSRAVLEEMKDFHGRLCAIEEKNRK
ncbi:MAG: hypothetical protein AABY22_16580 [Nanoarchaeota archaeon]